MQNLRPTRRRVTTVVASGVVAAAVLVGTVQAPLGALEEAPVQGAAGIGDEYFPKDGNGGYDVTHYDVDIERYRIATGALEGSTEITARATRHLARFNLDLMLDAEAVWVNGIALAPEQFVKQGAAEHELVVTPSAPIPQGTEFTVRVDYAGEPATRDYRGSNPWIRDRLETMATNEPHIAPWWFPANDHPRDKATFDIAVTVPSGREVISNGEMAPGSPSDDGEWATWSWSMDRPMATYLAFFAAGDFKVESGVSQGLPYVNAVSMQLGPAKRDRAMRLMRRHPAVVRWFEGLLGDYPFDSTGGVTTSLFSGFALENQARPTYPYLGSGGYARSIVVHEVAHQWFGNQVSVDRWRDIWLNEGFATWTEWKWDEAHGGRRAQETLRSHYSAYMRSDPFWNLTIADPGPRRLFAYSVYERGAMAVQALRHRIGNHDFRRLLRTWLSGRADGTGRVAQFKRLAEDISGKQLDGFFEAWLYKGAKPARTKANGLR